MNAFQRAERFHAAIKKEGLQFGFGHSPCFHFDLNLGMVHSVPEPAKVWRILEIAKKTDEDQLLCLLQTAVRRDKLGEPNVSWARSVHHLGGPAPDIITLEAWLIENGHDPSELRR
jgi:hypothetical protein